MEDMEQKGGATIDDPNSVMAYYGLARDGRDCMLEKLRPSARGAAPAAAPAQSAIDPRRSALRALQDEVSPNGGLRTGAARGSSSSARGR
jgi:hypothetical protein